jgi:hypothetical protein
LSPNLVPCVEGTRANGLPDAEIPELHGLRWLIDNATITKAQPSSVNCNTDVWSAALWDGACIAVTERKYWQWWRLLHHTSLEISRSLISQLWIE